MSPTAQRERELEVLADMEPQVRGLTAAHEDKRQLWFPADLMEPQDGEDPGDFRATLRRHAADLSGPARATMILGLITEEGLPHFHKMVADHFGDGSAWVAWRDMWTAEEERHGAVLQLYFRDAGIFPGGAIQRAQFDYIRKGFYPAWRPSDPYSMLAYTSLQERATQVTHANTGKLAGASDPVLARIYRSIAADEARHWVFYRAAFQAALERDPNALLIATARVMIAMDMPGVRMERFAELADVVSRADVYGPDHYRRIVEELIAFWGLETLTGLSPEGREAQDAIMALPARLARLAAHAQARRKPRTFELDDLCGLTFRME